MNNEKKILVINVLSNQAYDDCRIKNSISIPLTEFEMRAKDFDKEQPIVVYCATYHCQASKMAWLTLKKMGFTNIWAYEAGMNEWYYSNLPYEGSCKYPYLTQHLERPAERDKDINEITTDELYEMMKKHGLL